MVLGTYGEATSPIAVDLPVTYLHVRLRDGERWTYLPGDHHDVAWLATNTGKLHASGQVLEREPAIFAPGEGAVDAVAEGAAEFVIGSAAQHRHPLVLSHYSVHTSAEALANGERTIAELGGSSKVAALRAA